MILYDPEVFAASERDNTALDENRTQKVDESASCTTDNPEQPTTGSDLNDKPTPGNGSISESDTDTKDTLDTEAESTTPIADEQSIEETH